MNLTPIVLEHNERYGNLTVLRKEGSKYRVGCSCGYSGMLVRARALMRADGVRSCRKCRMNNNSFNRAINDQRVAGLAPGIATNEPAPVKQARASAHQYAVKHRRDA